MRAAGEGRPRYTSGPLRRTRTALGALPTGAALSTGAPIAATCLELLHVPVELRALLGGQHLADAGELLLPAALHLGAALLHLLTLLRSQLRALPLATTATLAARLVAATGLAATLGAIRTALGEDCVDLLPLRIGKLDAAEEALHRAGPALAAGVLLVLLVLGAGGLLLRRHCLGATRRGKDQRGGDQSVPHSMLLLSIAMMARWGPAVI